MRSHYSVNVADLFLCSIIIFHCHLWAHCCICLKIFFCSRNQAVAFTTSYEELFLFPHYCGIGDLSSVAWVAQTNDSMTGQGQGCRVDVPKVPSETVQQPLCPTWGVCSWIERATPLWQKSGSLSLACAVIAICHGVGLECCALKHELNVCDSLHIPALQLDQPFHSLILSWMYDHSLKLYVPFSDMAYY
jgi:hypothetical protein